MTPGALLAPLRPLQLCLVVCSCCMLLLGFQAWHEGHSMLASSSPIIITTCASCLLSLLLPWGCRGKGHSRALCACYVWLALTWLAVTWATLMLMAPNCGRGLVLMHP